MSPDPDHYAGFIGAAGEPALELGCGGGDPIIELRRRDLDVEGVDSSADMLERCRNKAAELGIEVVLHQQRMQDLELPRRYRSIYLAGATFNLLTTDDDARASLRRIRAHLTDNGSALVPLFIPSPTSQDRLGQPVEASEPDGTVIRCTPVEETRDEVRRTQVTLLRYERLSGDEHESEDRPSTLHWHTQEGFELLAQEAGLRTSAVLNPRGGPASPEDEAFTFWLQPD